MTISKSRPRLAVAVLPDCKRQRARRTELPSGLHRREDGLLGLVGLSESASEAKSGSRWRFASGFVGLLLRDQTADALGQERTVERLLERVVEPEREGLLARFVAGQGEQDRAQWSGLLRRFCAI